MSRMDFIGRPEMTERSSTEKEKGEVATNLIVDELAQRQDASLFGLLSPLWSSPFCLCPLHATRPLEDLEREIHLAERGGDLGALDLSAHLPEHLAGDRDTLRDGVLLGLLARAAHALDDGLGDRDARDLVGEELRVADRDERPDPRDHGDVQVAHRAEESRELRDIEYGLCDGVFGARFDLPFEAPPLVLGIDGDA